MNSTASVEVEVLKSPDAKSSETLAVARVESGAVSAERLSIEELRSNLDYIREIMRTVMKEGQDYGKIPGTGDKPSLLQPGAQKLCMTFQLDDHLKKEVMREFPGMHREYELTVTLRSAKGREWDGVGTCTTLESKYRYRKAERRCPKCGQNKIIQGKAEYGGGWLCYKKKGGCGEKFAEDDKRITSQPGGTVEYENPPDYWNTVRKMAFKRGLVHAAINATNTSELWTQDVEDMTHDEPPRNAPPASGKAAGAPAGSTQRPATKPAPPAAPSAAPTAKTKPFKPATEATRQWMLTEFKDALELLAEYFTTIGWLFPGETLQTLELRFVPNTKTKMKSLHEKLAEFGNGEQASKPYDSDEIPAAAAKPATTAGAPAKPAAAPAPPDRMPDEGPGEEQGPPPEALEDPPRDPEWWRNIIIPIPHKGQKKAEYDKNPETIGMLFDLRHGSDDEAQAARQRLFGLVSSFDPKPREFKGTVYQPSAADHLCRKALDAFADWFEKQHPGEKI